MVITCLVWTVLMDTPVLRNFAVLHWLRARVHVIEINT